MIIDFAVNPDVNGKDEIDSAPTIPQMQLTGMVRNSPPKSVHFDLPVMYRTEPALISKSAL